jgi:carboxylesterase
MTYINGSEPYSNITDSDTGVLVIHGFTGTTSSLMPLNDALTKSGYNVECPRLSGHGLNWIELEKVKYRDWFDDVERSLDLLMKRSKKVFLAGLSMGGALAMRLAEKHDDVKGVVLINNALILQNIKFFLLPILIHIMRKAPGIGSDIKDMTKKEICYDTVSTKAVYEMIKMLKVVKNNISMISQPALIFKSTVDHIVPKISALYTYDNISSTQKELIWLSNSYHVATLDYEKDLICEKTLDFIKKYS